MAEKVSAGQIALYSLLSHVACRSFCRARQMISGVQCNNRTATAQ